ncbi:type II toxin-antitoxin system Phd/YefM family antitoxin [Sphingomonas parva]|uniref:type II toxin-antitoxin system Phd/YefM family antitoxin n=1 Tax=Sphingomonas parva TaxID=2555898 RepID=UPI00142F509B|nr:type II toxin-antitoxin system Phd/YefM family antitoxin [Sphingomonas parva]
MLHTEEDPFAGVRKIDATDARQSFSDLVSQVAVGRRTLLMRNGKPVCAIVSLPDLHLLLARDASRDEVMRQSPPAEGRGRSFSEIRKSGAVADALGTASSSSTAVQTAAADDAATAIAQLVEATSRIVIERMRERGPAESVEEEKAEIAELVLASLSGQAVYSQEQAEEREAAGSW